MLVCVLTWVYGHAREGQSEILALVLSLGPFFSLFETVSLIGRQLAK